MARIKANNQYFAEYIESNIARKCGCLDIPDIPYSFDDGDIKEMNKEVDKLYLDFFSNFSEIEYTGRNYTNRGDFVCDGAIIELKVVSSGFGTYYNTSIYSLNNFVPIDFKNYLYHNGVYSLLNSSPYGKYVSTENASPVSLKMSRIVRKDRDFYTALKEKESNARAFFVKDVFDYLTDHPEILNDIYAFYIEKGTKIGHCDMLVVLNYKANCITKIPFNNIKSQEDMILKKSGRYSIIIGNIKLTFALQNGTGLNNPTIRIFLI